MRDSSRFENELRELIEREERKIAESFPRHRRFALMELARSMDYYWLRRHLGYIKDNRSRRAADLMEFGLNKALKMALDKSSKEELFPLAPSTEETKRWADSVLLTCGSLGRAENILEICRFGLGEILRDSQGSYRFQPAAGPIGMEAFEREDAEWYRGAVERFQRKDSEELMSRRPGIEGIMGGLVDIWNERYIQYAADPEVDDFYLEEGVLYSRGMFGQDSFPGNVQFGGQSFDLYRKIVGLLVGWSLRHIDFSLILFGRHPSLELRDIVTVPQDLDVIVSEISAALEQDKDAVEQAVAVLTLSLENKEVYCAVPGNFVAPAFVQGGRERLIKPIWGCLSHPFQTMLDGLRLHYRSDWDRGVDGREVYFRQELNDLFPSPRFATSKISVKIKRAGILVTDVDALVLDRQEGTLGLFQLKWQDTFRQSLRARESRKANFYGSGNLWVVRVSDWLVDVGDNGRAARALGFSEQDASSVRKIMLFVVGRHFAYFSGPGTLDARAAWCTWYKLLRTMAELQGNDASLESLFARLKATSPLSKALKVDQAEIRIGEATIILEEIERNS